MNLRILLAALICISRGQCIKRDKRLVALNISGLIAVKYNKQPIKLLNFSSSTLVVLSSLLNVFLIHGSGCWFAVLDMKFLQDFLSIFLLADEYFFFALHDFHFQKKSHETKIGHFKHLHHLLLEFSKLLYIASCH